MQRDFVALQWVTGEIEQASRQLGTELLGFADNLSDPTRLRHALTLAHQIRATLRMLNIPSAEQLAQESELLVQAMLHGQVPASEETLQILLAAGLQLPAYLRRVAQEQRELPLDVIDTTNALRTARGEAALPPPELELPGEFPELFEETGEGASDASPEDVQLLRQARQRFQAELLGLLRKEAPEERLHALGRVFGSLAQRLRPGGQRLMWQACAAACDAVPRGTLDAADPLIACLRKIDEEFRELSALERGFFRRRPSEDLFRDLLGIIADSLPATPGLIELQQRYRLLPTRTAPDGAVLEDLGATATVVGALSSELSAVLGKLEGTEGDALSTGLALREVEPDLRRIAAVLAGLGYRSEESLLSGHLAELSAGIPGGADAEERLTAITTALLDLDQRLAERVVRSGGNAGEAAARRHPLERAREAVCREVQLGLELSKQTVADFSQSDADVQILSPLPERLNAMAGALNMAGLQGAAGILASARDYTRAVRDTARPAPGVEEIDALADALSSVEYFMERLVIDGKPADLILVRAQAALRRVVPDVPPVVATRPVPRVEAVAPAQTAKALVPEETAPAPLTEARVEEASIGALPADTGRETPTEFAAAGPTDAAPADDQASAPVVGFEPEPEVAFEPEPGVTFEPEPEVAFEPEPEVAFEPEPEVAFEPEPEVTFEAEPEVAFEPEPEVAFEPEPEMTFEPAQEEAVVAPEPASDGAAPAPEPALELDVEEIAFVLEPEPVPEPTPPPAYEYEPELPPGLEPVAAQEHDTDHEPVAETPLAPVATPMGAPALAAEASPEPEAAIEGEELEPEILDIFVEEATEVLQTIATQLPLWRAVPTPGPALTELRRAFHTLKGSGRMVGAAVIGELAWSIENLLNRVIERMIEPGPAVLDMIERVQALMPSLVDAFANRRPPDAAAATRLREAAFALARGEMPAVPAPVAPEPDIEPAQAAEPAVEPVMGVEAEAEPEIEPETPPAALPEPEPEPEAPIEGEELEPEILDIFVEEATEVLQTIATQLPLWRAVPTPGPALTELRRAFHTLKGSGRMVGAAVIGELAWSIENLLNRVIERMIEPGPAVLDMIERVQALMPSLVDAFANRRPPDAAAATRLREAAFALARGEMPAVPAPEPVGIPETTLEAIREAETEADIVETAFPLAEELSLEERPSFAEELPVAAEAVDLPVAEPEAAEAPLETLPEMEFDAAPEPEPEPESVAPELPLDEEILVAEELPLAEELSLEERSSFAEELPVAAETVDLPVAEPEAAEAPLETLPEMEFDAAPEPEPEPESVAPELPLDEEILVAEELPLAEELSLEERPSFAEELPVAAETVDLPVAEPEAAEAPLETLPEVEFDAAPEPESVTPELPPDEEIPAAEELPLAEEMLLEERPSFAEELPVAGETVDLPVAEPEAAEAPLETLPEVEFEAPPEPEPEREREPQEATDIAAEDWLPEPEPVADTEVSIEDWLPELEPAEVAAAMSDEAAAEEAVAESVDADVRGIFAEEAVEHLAAVRAWLHAGRDTADDPLVRSVHTLRGGAHVAGLADLGALLDHLDAGVRAAGSSGRALVAAERDLLEQLCPLLDDYIGCSMLPDADLLVRTRALTEKAAAHDETTSAETAADAQAEARLTRFLEEALERLFHARNLLGAWRTAAAPQTDREHLLAELHTIHERAEHVGVSGVTPLSGGLLAAAGSLTEPEEQGMMLLDAGIEAFLDALDRLAAGQQPQPEQHLLDALAALAARPAAAPPEEPVPPVPAAPETETLRARIARELQQAEPELLGIFLEEAAELLASIDQSIDDWRHDRNDRGPFERLQRDLHTLKGGARMAGLRHLGELSHNLETFLINQGVQFGSFDDAFFQRVLEQHEQLLAVMDLVRGGASVPDSAPAADLVAPAASTEESPAPAPLPAGIEASVPAAVEIEEPEAAPEALTVRESIARDLAKADPDLLGIFLEEAEELMASVDAGIDAWRGARGNRAIFDKLQRDMHTLKGGARMAGISVLGDLAHEFESMLIAEGGDLSALPDAFFLRVAEFHEQLARAMDTVRARPEPGMPEPAAVAAVEAAAPAVPAAAPAAVPEETVAPAPVSAPAPPAPAPARIVTPPQTGAPAAAAAKPRDEVVRVSSQLLEDLVNLAGETSIARGRVEEQVSELGKLFEDMQSTIERLQGQVRRLDIATEAQILFRRERAETAGTEGFDPLEMDRYSQLQQLSRSLVESASDILDIKRTLAEKTRDLETVLIQQSRINSQLQEGLMRSRMVPFSSILPRIRRVVRQVATELDKSVELELGKMEGELDRGILERIVAPLEHMLRNAVDHGIESRERRIAAGKNPTGHIRIDISREGGDVLLALSDDGAGVNIAAVRRKAIERGLMSTDSLLGDHEITQFILHSGFSTAEKVTQISGRGVGMDVVSSEIRQMGGSLEIHSTPGTGSRFVIRLPFTVSVSRSLMVIVGSDTYALPLNTVEGVVRMPVADMARYTGPEAELLSYAGQQYAVRHLGQLLYPGEQRDLVDTGENVPVVLVRAGGQALAVEVDRLVGAREIVVKGLGPQFGAVPGLSGATVLGDGSVVLILDIPAMLRADSARGAQRAVELARPEAVPQAERPPLVMVVDDSVTVRKVTTRFLEREGMRVISAKDGAEAMVMLGEQVPDIMLLDIEMPHMDGFEVLSKLRLSDALRQLPVIMITSRTGDKHRERALSLGANMYLGKPYQESVLLGHIRTLLAAARQAAGG